MSRSVKGRVPACWSRSRRQPSAPALHGPSAVLGRLAAVLGAVGAVLAGPAPAEAQERIGVDGPPVWGPSPELEETLRFGELDGAPEYTFGRVNGLAVSESGVIWVVDSQVPVIRRYDPDGRYLGDVGREGQGPGEYGDRVEGIQPYPDGRMAIYDPRNARVTVYDTAGTYLESHPVQAGLYTADVFSVDVEGHFLVKAGAPAAEPGGQRRQVWLKIGPGGELVDSIPFRRRPSSGFVISTSVGFRAAFPSGSAMAWSPLGYVVEGDNRDYTLRFTPPDGTEHVLARPWEPVEVKAGEKTMWEAWAEAFRERGSAIAGFDGVPDRKPAFRNLRIDSEGRIWIDRYAEAERRQVEPRAPDDPRPPFEWRQRPTYDVIEPDGTFLGTLVFPPGVGPWFARGDEVWSVTSGELGEAYVVRYRIAPGGG